MAYARIDPGTTRDALAEATLETLRRNLDRLDAESDFALWHVICRGDSAIGRASPAIVAIFCVEIAFAQHAVDYLKGLHVVTPSVRRTPPQSIDPKAKVTSRMNQVQAALEVGRTIPGAIPLLLDGEGNLAETNTGNFFFVTDGRLCTPSARNVLGGVTRATIMELAETLGIGTVEGDFTPYDVYAAHEAFVCSTSPSILPVGHFNGASIGASDDTELPGPMTLRLMNAFFELVGVDFVAQAISHLGGNQVPDLAAEWAARRSAMS